jgi:carbonic anhydrase/acetyltransferase-like protein (isoleucine patch superfamily)
VEGPLGHPYVAPGARLVGDVRMAAGSSVFHGSVVDGTAAPIEIGVEANIQDNCVVESRPGLPVRIGARVSLGHNARVYGATIDDSALIAIGASVLAGARVGSNSIVAANATVPEGMQVPPRTLVIGHGRIQRSVSDAEVGRIEHGADEYVRLSRDYRSANQD